MKCRQSQILRKFAAYPRQHELAGALREIGRVDRTLFIIDWLLDADMQRRAEIGLNKRKPTMPSKMPCALAAKVKSATEQPHASTSVWLHALPAAGRRPIAGLRLFLRREQSWRPKLAISRARERAYWH